jgi:hypothetical protein
LCHRFSKGNLPVHPVHVILFVVAGLRSGPQRIDMRSTWLVGVLGVALLQAGCLEGNTFVDPATLDAALDTSASTDAATASDVVAGSDAAQPDSAATDAIDTDAGDTDTNETDSVSLDGSDASADGSDAAPLDTDLAEPDADLQEIADAGSDAVEPDAGNGSDQDVSLETDLDLADSSGEDTDPAETTNQDAVDAAPDTADVQPADGQDDAANPDTGDPCLTLDCNDFNPCTADSCANGACTYADANVDCPDDGCLTRFCAQGVCSPTGGFLDVGSPCFDKVSGKGGFCTGATAICGECATDGACLSDNPCVDPKCVLGVCKYDTTMQGAPCSDNNPCTVGDSCGSSLAQGTAGCKPGTAKVPGSSCTTTTIDPGLCGNGGQCEADSPTTPFVVFGGAAGCNKPGWTLDSDPTTVWATSPATCNALATLTPPATGAMAMATTAPLTLPTTNGYLQVEWTGACRSLEAVDQGTYSLWVNNGQCRLEVSTDNFQTLVASQVFPASLTSSDPATTKWDMALPLPALSGQTIRLRLVVDALTAFPQAGFGSGGVSLSVSNLAIVLHDSGQNSCQNGSECDDGDACTLDVCNLGACVYPGQPDFPCGGVNYTPDATCLVGSRCSAVGQCQAYYAGLGSECITDLAQLGMCVNNLQEPGQLKCKPELNPKDPQEPF